MASGTAAWAPSLSVPVRFMEGQTEVFSLAALRYRGELPNGGELHVGTGVCARRVRDTRQAGECTCKE